MLEKIKNVNQIVKKLMEKFSELDERKKEMEGDFEDEQLNTSEGDFENVLFF